MRKLLPLLLVLSCASGPKPVPPDEPCKGEIIITGYVPEDAESGLLAGIDTFVEAYPDTSMAFLCEATVIVDYRKPAEIADFCPPPDPLDCELGGLDPATCYTAACARKPYGSGPYLIYLPADDDGIYARHEILHVLLWHNKVEEDHHQWMRERNVF